MAKKYYKSLDHMLLAAAAHRKGKPVEAAKHFIRAMEEDDAEDLMDDLNSQQDEAVDPESATATFARALAAKSKKAASKKVTAGDDEDADDADEDADDEDNAEEASDDNTDITDMNTGEGESVEDEVVARMQVRAARAARNKRLSAKK